MLGFSSEKIFYTRAQRDSNYSEQELDKIEEFYAIKFERSNISTDCVEIEHIHINPSCGKGTIVLDEAEITPCKAGKSHNKQYFKDFKTRISQNLQSLRGQHGAHN